MGEGGGGGWKSIDWREILCVDQPSRGTKIHPRNRPPWRKQGMLGRERTLTLKKKEERKERPIDRGEIAEKSSSSQLQQLLCFPSFGTHLPFNFISSAFRIIVQSQGNLAIKKQDRGSKRQQTNLRLHFVGWIN